MAEEEALKAATGNVSEAETWRECRGALGHPWADDLGMKATEMMMDQTLPTG